MTKGPARFLVEGKLRGEKVVVPVRAETAEQARELAMRDYVQVTFVTGPLSRRIFRERGVYGPTRGTQGKMAVPRCSG